MPIIAPAGQIEVEPESVHLQFLGLGQSETAAGRVPRIVDVERLAAAVHVTGWFDEDRLLTLCPKRVPALRMLPGETPLLREKVDDREADVVPGAVVFRSGIPQSCD